MVHANGYGFGWTGVGMGFDEETARAALERAGWCVERAIDELCKDM